MEHDVLLCLLWDSRDSLLQVLENFSDAPMTPKQILHVIQTKGLKEMRSATHTLIHSHTSAEVQNRTAPSCPQLVMSNFVLLLNGHLTR